LPSDTVTVAVNVPLPPRVFVHDEPVAAIPPMSHVIDSESLSGSEALTLPVKVASSDTPNDVTAMLLIVGARLAAVGVVGVVGVGVLPPPPLLPQAASERDNAHTMTRL
jgi:hypothetical protein